MDDALVVRRCERVGDGGANRRIRSMGQPAFGNDLIEGRVFSTNCIVRTDAAVLSMEEHCHDTRMVEAARALASRRECLSRSGVRGHLSWAGP